MISLRTVVELHLDGVTASYKHILHNSAGPYIQLLFISQIRFMTSCSNKF